LSEDSLRKKNRLIPVFFIFFALSAVILFIFISSHPLGVSPDSTVYIEAARNLASGKGYFARGEPLTHFPPGYPLFLTLATWIGGEVFPTANWMQAGLFLINGLMVGVIVFFSSGKSYLPAILGILFFFCSLVFFEIHSMAWSEGLFLLSGILSGFFLYRYLSSKKRWWLLASGVLLSIAILTRYIGIVLLPAAWVCLWWFNGRSQKKKWADTGMLILIACIPFVLFVINNALTAGNIANRDFAVHLPGIVHIKSLLVRLFDFWIPQDFTRWIKLPLLMILALSILLPGYGLMTGSNKLRTESWQFTWLFGCAFIFFYLSFLAFSLSFLDASTPLDRRILSPIFTAVLLLFLGPTWKWLKEKEKVWMRALVVVWLGLSIAANLYFTGNYYSRWKSEGLGYSSDSWSQMDIVQLVKTIPERIKIYSNAQDLFIFLTQKPISRLPYKSDPTSLQGNPDYGQEMQAMCKEVRTGDATIVMIVKENWRWYYPTVDEILSTCDQLTSKSFGEGILIGVDFPYW
jgi:4-amino-4-deoxy-L-arabinose transferase-like glycosyltransferase